MTEGTTVIGYVRVSTRSQGDAGLGLEAQRRAIRDKCEREGWKLLRIEEEVESGKSTTNRPALASAIAACETGEAQGLVAAKLDRLARSLLDFVSMVEKADDLYRLVVVEQGFDLGTKEGRLTANILASFAQYERELISERTKAALAVARAEQLEGPRPARRDGTVPKAIGRPREIGSELRERIAGLRMQGQGYRAIARTLNEEGAGGRSWHAGSVRRIAVSIGV